MQIPLNWPEIRKNSLFVALPMYGGQCASTFFTAMNGLTIECLKNGIQMNQSIIANESLITRARNYCVDSFLQARWGEQVFQLTFDNGLSIEVKDIASWANENDVSMDLLNQLFTKQVNSVKSEKMLSSIINIEQKVIEHPFTHLLFVDADIKFNPVDVIMMLAIYTSDPEKYKILSGIYSKKCISWEKIYAAVKSGAADDDPNKLEQYVGDYVFNPLQGNGVINLAEPIKVAEVGTGFLMVHRSVFEKIIEDNPDIMYYPDHIRTKEFDGSRKIACMFDADIDRGFWDQSWINLMRSAAEGNDVKEEAKNLVEKLNKASLRYLSEDYFFCRMAMSSGFDIWMLPWIHLEHFGSFNFTGSLEAQLRLGLNPTADPKLLGKKPPLNAITNNTERKIEPKLENNTKAKKLKEKFKGK